MRKPYLDHLRGLAVLLLFPVHTCMVWNDFGSRFYVWAGESRLLSTVIVLINPWFMPLLFAIAGISARHALGKYPPGEFLRRRAWRLLLPFFWGTALLCPLQTLYARKYFYRYDGGFWENWVYFFTHVTDLTGYDGGFTLGHLWFLLFLFLISALSLPLFAAVPPKRLAGRVGRLSLPGLLLLFLPVWGMYHLGNFGGFSLGKSLALYLAGYYLLSDDRVLERLDRSLPRLLGLWGAVLTASALLYFRFSYYGDLWVCFAGWLGILVLLPLGRRFWDRETGATALLRRASYPVYLLHQPILVALAYYTVSWRTGRAAQVLIILFDSLLLTLLASALLERIPAARVLLGIQIPGKIPHHPGEKPLETEENP